MWGSSPRVAVLRARRRPGARENDVRCFQFGECDGVRGVQPPGLFCWTESVAPFDADEYLTNAPAGRRAAEELASPEAGGPGGTGNGKGRPVGTPFRRKGDSTPGWRPDQQCLPDQDRLGTDALGVDVPDARSDLGAGCIKPVPLDVPRGSEGANRPAIETDDGNCRRLA